MRRVRRFVSAVLGRARFERDMSREMAQHLELEIEDRIAGGLSPSEARRTALRDFGGVERWKEEARAVRGVGVVDAIRQDLRYAVRALRGSPGFAVVSVVTLALGIGATTAVYSVVDGLLLEPLGYEEPERVVRLLEYDADGGGRGTIAAANYRDWVAQATSFEHAAMYDEYRPTLRLDDGALKVDGASVGVEYFDVLGVRPRLGRFFLAEEAEGGSRRAVLSDGLWREVFGADPAVIGRSIDLDGFPYTVVGVAAPFEDPGLSGGIMGAPRIWRSPPSYFDSMGRGGRSFTAVARLAPGVSVEEAGAELSAIHARLAVEYPEENADKVVRVVPLRDDLVSEAAPVLWILFGSVGLVLLIACANVANLLLFRAVGRGREIALRSALGASRMRILRQLLVESLLLGLVGAAAGVGVAFLATRGVVALAADRLPRVETVGIDPGVLGFALAVGLLAALVFGLVPAAHTARPSAIAALKEGRGQTGGRGRSRLRTTVVAAEVALAVVVMLGAGLLVRSLLALERVDPGVAADRVLVVRTDPPVDPYDPWTEAGSAAITTLNERLTSRVARVPGVEAVGITDLLPMSGNFDGNGFRVVGRPEPAPGQLPAAETRSVTPGYFDVMRVPVLEGRGIAAGDDADARRVVVVNRAFVREHFPAGDALGQAIRIFDPDAPPARIVGVVGDVTQFSLDEDPVSTIYIPHPQAPSWKRDEPWIAVRTAMAPESLVPGLQAAIREVEPGAPIYDIASMRAVVDRTLAPPRFRTGLLGAFALLAFLLAIVGVYGMMAYTAASRIPEIGVRMALGADASQVRRLIVGQGLRPVLVGALIGLLVGLAAVRLLAGYLYGVSATDPITFIAAPALLATAAAVAAWLPARRAARLAPGEVLRSDQ